MTDRRSPSSSFVQFGVATLVAGVVSGIAAGCLTDPDKCTIILSRNTPGGTLGFLSAPLAQRGASDVTFRISSSNAADTSTVNWIAIPKNVGLAESTTFKNNASLRRSPSGLNVITGFATLVAGTKQVTGLAFGPNAKVFAMAKLFHGTPGKLSVPDATVDDEAGTITINSNSNTDTSEVGYVIIDQPPRFSPSGVRFSQSKGTLNGTTEFDDMNPTDDTRLVVMASVITGAGADTGNLSGAVKGNGTITVSDGACEVLSDGSDDDSLVELCCF